MRIRWLARLATALLLCVIPAAAAETSKPFELPFERIALPNVGRITHLAPESASRVWLLSEAMDVLVVEGRTARTVRNGSWAFESPGPNTFQNFSADSVAAADSALVIAGAYHSLLGSFSRGRYTPCLVGEIPLGQQVRLG